MADIESKEPITQDSVFRIGSITKTVTAIAGHALWEQAWSIWTPRPPTTCAPSS